jgi:hypothetical protein
MKRVMMIPLAGALALAPFVSPQQAEARSGGAIAAGVIGGLAAGAVIGAASNAYAGPYWGYPGYYGSSYSYGYAPAYAYGPAYAYDDEPVVVRRVVQPRRYYRSARVVRSYPYSSAYYGAYGPRYAYWGGPSVNVGFGPAWW